MAWRAFVRWLRRGCGGARGIDALADLAPAAPPHAGPRSVDDAEGEGVFDTHFDSGAWDVLTALPHRVGTQQHDDEDLGDPALALAGI